MWITRSTGCRVSPCSCRSVAELGNLLRLHDRHFRGTCQIGLQFRPLFEQVRLPHLVPVFRLFDWRLTPLDLR